MISDFEAELDRRAAFVGRILRESGAAGVVLGLSGGKDSALAAIICKKACDNTLGVLLPCSSKRNYAEDTADALALAEKFRIKTRTLDLARVLTAALKEFDKAVPVPADAARNNLPPRLRMAALYYIAASENRLVAGTGNRSEAYTGYFTKFGDGAYDFNPIADLTVTEIYDFLRYLKVPQNIIEKPPSAALFDGQTDEGEMGVTYAALDNYIINGVASEKDKNIIEAYHRKSGHKRTPPLNYGAHR